MTHSRQSGDGGSVMLLVLGFIAIIMIAIAVVTDVSAVFLQRRSLASIADGAALAGTQAVDLSGYYRRGASAGLSPDPTQVRAVVLEYVRNAQVAADMSGLVVESVRVEGRTVLVRLRRTATAPFSGLLRANFPIRVEAGAELQFR